MRKTAVVLLVFGLLLGGCTTQQAGPSEWDEITPGPQDEVCTDSDGGKNEFIAGTASIGDDVRTDRCLGDGEMVLEYYCEEGRIKDEDISCPAGYTCYGGGMCGSCLL
jgi:hypothetical protein